MRYTPDNITELALNEIFVFGSNEAGIMGAGAAKLAADKFGARAGVGVGLMGQSYAIPTKDLNIKTLPLNKIYSYIDDFIRFAERYPKMTYLVTKVGCGLAHFSVRDIAPAFRYIPANVILPKEFVEYNKNSQ